MVLAASKCVSGVERNPFHIHLPTIGVTFRISGTVVALPSLHGRNLQEGIRNGALSPKLDPFRPLAHFRNSVSHLSPPLTKQVRIGRRETDTTATPSGIPSPTTHPLPGGCDAYK